MRSLFAFVKKEFTEKLRTGRLFITLMLFVLFGIMNPAIAKMTPWFLELFEESLSESGITVTDVEVSALDSWMQFFKNIPVALIAFVLLEGAVFTKEYTSGTLILSLTKGLSRFKVVIAKTGVLLAVWSVGFFLCYGITYLYNSYFWDNSVAQNLSLSVVCWWLFGVFVISLMTLFSVLFSSNTGVLLGVGAVSLALYIVGLIPKVEKYLPTALTDGNSLIYGLAEAEKYTPSIIITAALSIVLFAVSIPIFNKKQL